MLTVSVHMSFLTALRLDFADNSQIVVQRARTLKIVFEAGNGHIGDGVQVVENNVVLHRQDAFVRLLELGLVGRQSIGPQGCRQG